MNFAGVQEMLNFFQNFALGAKDFWNWLTTPWDGLSFVGLNVPPIALFGLSAVLIILGLHVAHLINVIFG